MFYTINFKEIVLSAEDVEAYLELEIEKAKNIGAKGFKIIHGYGSHGKGGKILQFVRLYAQRLKRNNIIKDVIYGNAWNISNQSTLDFIKYCKDSVNDEDLNNFNPGITIIVL